MELVSLKEIAASHGVAYNSAWRWSQRADFPEPVARPGGRPIWRAGDVQKWAKSRLPLREGRPPKRTK